MKTALQELQAVAMELVVVTRVVLAAVEASVLGVGSAVEAVPLLVGIADAEDMAAAAVDMPVLLLVSILVPRPMLRLLHQIHSPIMPLQEVIGAKSFTFEMYSIPHSSDLICSVLTNPAAMVHQQRRLSRAVHYDREG